MRSIVFVLASLASCTPGASTSRPLVGAYAIESTLVSNGCGQGGLDIPAVTELEAEVYGYAGDSAELRWTASGNRAFGFATSSGTYAFESNVTRQVIAADASLGYPGCSLTEHTEVTFDVDPVPLAPADAGVDAGGDAGVPASTLEGSITIDVYPTAGSNCTPLLGANGGPYLAVPCQATIDLTGSRVR